MADHASSFSELVDFVALLREADVRAALPYVKLIRRVLRDRQNVIEMYNDREFLGRFRFSKRAVVHLLSILPLAPSPDDRGSPVPPLLQLLVTLRFYGGGTFQVVTGDLVSISQPSVSRIIERVTTVIAATLFPALVKLPDAAQASRVMDEFYRIAKFPGVTGCMDCTHIRIKSPGGKDAEVFRCRKGYFSFNVQAITGPRLQFFDLVASWPGSNHDSRIFDNSHARARYEDGEVQGVLLGDMGYACRRYLMTPLKEPKSSAERRYNNSQKTTRCTIERVFGIWKRRFPCLDMKLQIKTSTSVLVITACAALHNLSRHLNDPIPPDVHPAPAAPPPTATQQGPAAQPGPPMPPDEPQQSDTEDGFRARRRIIRDYFSR
ncbi:putative nuclease HARBI1 [Dermacentor andersoni]|uniref:putative nuclease HARBI1 n=1 Tax=Dermacentor andersoni TaxID=34620 RepID=UPI00215592A5|nr:putative nuclease HARBI1 [Dermacentor andersoni]